MKTFDLEKYGTTHKIQLNVRAYSDGGGLAITMDDWACGYAELWNTLTVNLDSPCPRDTPTTMTGISLHGLRCTAWQNPPAVTDAAVTADTRNTVSARKSCRSWILMAI